MPIYEYLCPDGHRFDVVQRFSRRARDRVRGLRKPVHRVLHAPAVHYKGKGFYSTDYGRGGKAANGDRADSSSSSDSGSKESSSSGSDSKSSDSGSKSESKSSESKSSDSKSSGGESSSSKKSDSSKPAA